MRVLEKIDSSVPVALVIFLGTSGRKKALLLRRIEAMFDISQVGQIVFLAFDAAGVESNIDVPAVYPDIESITLDPDEFNGIKLPDSASLAEAERDGTLWRMKPTWHLNPGVVCDNNGTGGNQRNGAALWSLSEKLIRPKINGAIKALRDYRAQQRRIDIADDGKSSSNTIPVIVCHTDLGGMASSGADDICGIAGEEAAALKCDVRIIRLSLVLGCINPVDREMAARNELLTLKKLQMYLDGNYGGINGNGKAHRPHCDSVVMISDANNDGSINSLEALYAATANYLFYLLSTPMGHELRERAVDIEEGCLADSLGGTRRVTTASITKIHVDVPRIVENAKYRMAGLLYDSFLQDASDESASRDAMMFAEKAKITETVGQNTALDRVFSIAEYNGADIRQHITTMFSNLVGRIKGSIAGCIELAHASKQVIEGTLLKNAVSQIKCEAASISDAFKSVVRKQVDLYLEKSDGISRADKFLAKLAETIEQSDHSNDPKLDRAIAKAKNSSARLAKGHDMLAQLCKAWWFIQMISIFKKAAIRRIFMVQTDLSVKNSLEVEGRTVLKNQLYPALRRVVTSQSCRIQSIRGKIGACKSKADSQAQRLKTMSSILMVPIGRQIATPEFMDRQFERICTNEGGVGELLKKLYQQFREIMGDLRAFETHDNIRQESLLEYCGTLANAHVEGLKVVDVFKDECSAKLKQHIEMAIKESRGRLRISGEGTEFIPMIKLIGVHDRSAGEWIAEIANQVDTHSGVWKIIQTGDPNSIVFIQQRSRVSLTRIIQECRQFWKEPSDPVQRVQLGADPIISLAPGTDCSSREIDTVIAMGLSTGHIKAESSGFILNHQDDPIPMGNSLSQVRKYLKNDYPGLIGVYCGFVKKLTNDAKTAMKALDTTAGNTECTLVGELGGNPFAGAKAIAEALMPHIRRIKID